MFHITIFKYKNILYKTFLIKNINCKVVITSGRGFTPDIEKLNRYFLAYSTTSNLLLDPNNRSKAHLINCLSQLRILNT